MTWTTALCSRLHATNALRQQVWALSDRYFRSEEKWKALAMPAAIVALNLALVYMAPRRFALQKLRRPEQRNCGFVANAPTCSALP